MAEGTAGTLWHLAGRRLGARPAVRLALTVLALIVLVALLGPLFSPWGFDSLDWQHLATPPTRAAMNRTDRLGRICSCAPFTACACRLISVLASLVSLVIGVAWGAVAGFSGPRTDGFMMRIVDVCCTRCRTSSSSSF